MDRSRVHPHSHAASHERDWALLNGTHKRIQWRTTVGASRKEECIMPVGAWRRQLNIMLLGGHSQKK